MGHTAGHTLDSGGLAALVLAFVVLTCLVLAGVVLAAGGILACLGHSGVVSLWVKLAYVVLIGLELACVLLAGAVLHIVCDG